MTELAERTNAQLIAALNNPDWRIRREAVRSLTELGAKDALEPLIKVLKDETEIDHVRRFAAEGLASFGDEKAIEPLLEASAHKSHRIRQGAIWGLSQFDTKRLLNFFIGLVKDQDSEVQALAIQALIRIGDKQAVKPLLDLLQDCDEFYIVRAEATLALGQLGGQEAVPALIARLEDEEPAVREGAAVALGQLKATEALPALTKLQQSDNNQTDKGENIKDAVNQAIEQIRKFQDDSDK